MSNDVSASWSKELKVLLDKMERQPSAVTDQERDRLAVLRQLIKGRAPEAAV